MRNTTAIAAALALMLSAGVGLAQQSNSGSGSSKTQNNIQPRNSNAMGDMQNDEYMATGIDAIPDSSNGYCDDLGDRKVASSAGACRILQEQSDANNNGNSNRSGTNGNLQ